MSSTSSFLCRHIGPSVEETHKMLLACGFTSVEALIEKTIPENIRLSKDIALPKALTENEALQHMQELASKNKLYKTYIGQGYHPTILPSVIQRNILENPGWYTAYTPYQAEISQGRMEALLNYQTLIMELTGMEIANASMLDEATASAEAMQMLFAINQKENIKLGKKRFFVDAHVFAQTKAVLQTKARGLGFDLVVGSIEDFDFDDPYFGLLLQYPNAQGAVKDYESFTNKANQNNIGVAVAADILALTILKPPGKWGADVVVGTSQRFGVPMGYGGPHAAYFATKEHYKRFIPGRIIGISVDKEGNRALRMALQTREQHIKREKATSNICTAQVLLAVMAGTYAVYHGAEGLQHIALSVHRKTQALYKVLENLGYELLHSYFFDTLAIKLSETEKDQLETICQASQINLHYTDWGVQLSINEPTTWDDLSDLQKCFASLKKSSTEAFPRINSVVWPENLSRTETFLEHVVFHKYRSETKLMRYLKYLENKDLALNRTMIPLGSCTMKLNPATTLLPLSWPLWNGIHPFVPKAQAQGYIKLITELEQYLSQITGLAATSLQPNSGAQGEYAGLMVIRAYQEAQGEAQRDIVLVPASAHGTNPASAIIAGYKVQVVKTQANGDIDIEDLASKIKANTGRIAALMITYPSTHGIFESSVKEVIDMVHQAGGQVYLDGANMNAQVGYTHPGHLGADVCHLNLHKTFSIPHGGGGPGVGPICVAAHLAPYLPAVTLNNNNSSTNYISAAPYGSASILVISYLYIRMLGVDGLKKVTAQAIINANYLKARLQEHYPILYTGTEGCIAHEMILDCRPFKPLGIEVTDIAKRLIDYGFHAPTVSFPVAGTLMVEPTESEDLEELDRFCSAMINIKKEIKALLNHPSDARGNLLKNAPHTLKCIMQEQWDMPYSQTQAAFPMQGMLQNKYWPAVSRIDEAHGDRNLICSCVDIEAYNVS